MAASRRPSTPEMMVRRTFLLSRLVRMDRPRKVTTNISLGPNFSAACVSCGLRRNIARAENRPPMAEVTSDTPSALPASPLWAIG